MVFAGIALRAVHRVPGNQFISVGESTQGGPEISWQDVKHSGMMGIPL